MAAHLELGQVQFLTEELTLTESHRLMSCCISSSPPLEKGCAVSLGYTHSINTT